MIAAGELEAEVMKLARAKGWRVYLRGQSQRAGSHPGFPSLVLLRPPLMLFVFLGGRLANPSQDEALWLNAAELVAGVKTHEWTPLEWERGEIEDALR